MYLASDPLSQFEHADPEILKEGHNSKITDYKLKLMDG